MSVSKPLTLTTGCPSCENSVSSSVEKKFIGLSWHVECFQCTTCKKQLETENSNIFENQLFCNHCHQLVTGAQYKPQKPMGIDHILSNNSCPLCKDRVYFAEQILALGKKWHKKCFKCHNCSKVLETGHALDHEGMPFCKSCHGKNFGPRGYGFAGGSGAVLSMDKPSHDKAAMSGTNVLNSRHDAINSNNKHVKTIKPAASQNCAAFSKPNSNSCDRCGKTVYFAEMRRAAQKVYHTNCFLCCLCNKKLEPGQFFDHLSDIYCRVCYGKKCGPKGYGYGVGAGILQSDH